MKHKEIVNNALLLSNLSFAHGILCLTDSQKQTFTEDYKTQIGKYSHRVSKTQRFWLKLLHFCFENYTYKIK